MMKAMWKKLASGLMAAFLLLSGVPVSALSIESDWIVEFRSEETARNYLDAYGGRMLGGTMVLTRGTYDHFEGRGDVLSLTEDSRVKGAAVSANDPRRSDQYYLTDPALYATQAWNYLDQTLSAKELTEAESALIRVAVIDTGVDGTHEDLVNRVTAGFDAVNETAIPAGTDSDISSESHGTKVAGLIAAEADNNLGIAGTAYTLPVNVVPVRALDSDATGKLSDIVAALYWAVDEGNADIVNMSFGMRRSTRPAALEAAVRHAAEQGVMLIAAAGNEGRYVNYEDYHYYPAALDGVMAVGSLTKSVYSRYYGTVPAYSSFTNRLNVGYGETPVGKSFFYTSGEDLLTTAKGNRYETFTGTSASAAVFSGMVASLLSVSRATEGIDPRAAITTSSARYGSVLYHRFDTAAQNMKNGRSTDAWWSWDTYQPYILRGSVDIAGTLNDPSYTMSAVRAVLVDSNGETTELASLPRTADKAQQPVSFTLDTEEKNDGEVTLRIIGTYAAPSSPEESEVTLYNYYFTIDNHGSNYLLSAIEDDEPLVGTTVCLYSSEFAQDGRTDSLGNFAVNAAEADKGGMVALVEGEENLFVWSLETHPRHNAYILRGEPSTLTVTASAEALAKVQDAPLLLVLPDGSTRELAEITGESVQTSLCTNMPLTFLVRNGTVTLSKEISLADGSKTWNLDETLAASTTLKVQSACADASGLLVHTGENTSRLPAEGGEIILPPEEYDVTVDVYQQDDPESSYATGFTVNFGKVDLTSDRTLSVGDAVQAAFTLVRNSIVQNETLDVAVTFKDSLGHEVSDITNISNIDDPDYTVIYSSIGNYSLHLERKQEDESWEDLDSQFIEWERTDSMFTASVSTSLFNNVPGEYRARLNCQNNWPIDLSESEWHPFTVTAEESRPSARVNFIFKNENGYFESGAGFYVLLKDENDQWISRKAMTPADYWSEPCYTFLPVGQSYSGAMMTQCYSNTMNGYAAVGASFTVDLTDKAAGDTVEVTIQPDENWKTTYFNYTPGDDEGDSAPVDDSDLPSEEEEESDSVDFNVCGVTIYPFASLPEAAVRNARDDYSVLEGIMTRDLGEMALDVTMRSYMDNCITGAVSTLTHDFSENGSIPVSLPLRPTLTGAQEEYYSGSDVTLDYRLLDKTGNEIKSLSYEIREKEEYVKNAGSKISSSGSKPEEPEVKAYVTVFRANGSKVGTYDLDSLYTGSVTVKGLPDGRYFAAATVDYPVIGLTGGTIAFTVGGEAPPAPEKIVPAPTDFTAKAQSVTSIVLQWNALEEAPAKYLLYRDGQPFAELAGEAVSYTNEGITADRYYTYTLYAVDGEGDRSEGVNAGSRPAAQPDDTPPTVPTGLKAKTSGSEVLLSWERSSDNVAVTNYVITCNGEEVGRSYNRSFAHAGLTPGAVCIYTVSAVDGAGNRSAESESVSVTLPDNSGISYATLNYRRNKAGQITGDQMAVSLRATSDITTVKFTVSFGMTDGTSDSATVTLSGGRKGSFSGKINLSDEVKSVEKATVSAYKSGNSEPVGTVELLSEPVTRAGELTVALTNAQHKTLPECADKVNVTLSGKGGKFSVTRTIENFSGSFICFPPASEDYLLTVTGEDGSVLLTRQNITVTGEDGSLSMDAAGMNKLLSVTFTGLPEGVSYAGLEVSANIGSRRATGVLDADGHIVWSDGGRLLSFRAEECYSRWNETGDVTIPYVNVRVKHRDISTENAIYRVSEVYYTVDADDLMNDATQALKFDYYNIKTITAHIEDNRGRPVKGVKVDIAGQSGVTVVTDATGTASARVPLYHYYSSWNDRYYDSQARVSVRPQTTEDGMIWGSASSFTLDACRIQLTPKSDQFRFVPDISCFIIENNAEREMTVSESDLLLSDVTATLTKINASGWYGSSGKKSYDMLYYNGMWSASGLTMTDGEEYRITMHGSIGSREWSGVYEGTFDIDAPVVSAPVELHEKGRHRVTLIASDEGLLPGVSRRFIVFDQNGEKLSDTVSPSAFTYVALPYGEYVYVVATFDTDSDNTLSQWKQYGKWAKCQSFRVTDNTTPYQFQTAYGADFNNLFWQENGYSGTPSQQRLPDGEWLISFRYTAWGAAGTRSKFDTIALPEGAHDVNISEASYCTSYDAETHTIRIDQSKIGLQTYHICYYNFKISAADLEKNPQLMAWFDATMINGTQYSSAPRKLNLKPSGVSLIGLESVYREDLLERAQKDGDTRKGGYELTVNSTLYGDGTTVTIYDNDTLLVNQALRWNNTQYDLPIGMDYGPRTLTVIVTKGDVQDVQTKQINIIHDNKPAVINMNVQLNDGGGTVVGKNASNFRGVYRHRDIDSLSVTVQMRRPDLIEKVWAVAKGGKFKTSIGLKHKGDGQYQGDVMLSCKDDPVTSVEVLYTGKEDTSDSIRLAIDFDAALGEEGGTYHDIAYWEGPSAEQREKHLVSSENNPKQAQALSDWDRYVDLIQHAEHMDGDEFFEKLDAIYGEDGEWTLPMAKGDNGEEFCFTFIKDSERAKKFLAGSNAFTMLIGEDKVRMGYDIEYDPNGEDVLLHIYGDIDYFYPRVPEPDTVSADWFWENDYGGHQNVKRTVVKSKRPKPNIPGAGEVIAKGIQVGKLIDDYKDDPDYSDYDDIINDPCATVSQKEAAKQKKLLAMGQHVGDMAIDTISQIGPDETNAGTWGHMALGGGLGYLGNRWDQLNEILDQDPSRTANPCDRPPKNDDDDDDDTTAGTGRFNPLVDPSGIIFEAAEENVLRGVTASVYYKDSESNEWVLWNSEAYDQNPNPMQSFENGWYGWDVLIGKWKVVFEKDGYFLAESQELDVPPEHTDVNISLVSSLAPQVKEFTAKADGSSVTLTFDKYMLTEDILREGAVTVTFGGIIPGGKLTAIDPVTTAAGNKQADSVTNITGGSEAARQFVYTFDDPLPEGAAVNVIVGDEVSAYNGMTLVEAYSGSVVVPESDPVVYADSMAFEDDSLLEKTTGDTFPVGDLSFNGVKPGIVRYESSDESVITVDADGNVTAVGAGYATVWATCDTLEAGRPVNVTRVPNVPDENDNAVVFCRRDNLIFHKGCWMWSDAANFDLEDPIEGDGKYLAVSWRILENGTEKAGATLEEGLYAVKEYYTPTATGTLTGEITYQLYTYHEGKWVIVEGETFTARKDMNVVTVTGLSVKTPPASVGIGDRLHLNELVLNVHTSDGLTSEVPYANFYRWGMTLSAKNGKTLTKADRVLTITHPDSGSTVNIELWPSTEHAITVTDDGNGTAKASVEKADPGDTVTLTAIPNDHYRLKEWKVISGEISIADNQFTMRDTDVSVKAIFEPDHTLTHFAEAPATCEEDGSIEYWHCDGCGKFFADADGATEITKDDTVLQKLGHDWNEGAATLEPTCDSDGTKVYTCQRDASHTKTEAIPALGHNLTLVPAVEATCEEDGHSAYYKCERCGRLFADGTAAIEITDPDSVILHAPGHDWGEWVTVTPATETAEGLEKRTCQRDPSHEETRVIPKLQHVHVLSPTKELPATCENDGHTAYWTCGGCGKLFADAEGTTEIAMEDTVLRKLGHAWDEGFVTTQPTCEGEGVKTFTCKHDASHTRTEVIPSLGHDLQLVPAVAATCESEGHIAYYECTRCRKLFSDAAGTKIITQKETAVPATGHRYGSPVWTWQNDHTAAVTLTCEHDASHTKTIPAKMSSKTTEATCEAAGKTVYTATATFENVPYTDEQTEILPALGHDLTLVNAVPATCETAGSKAYYYCERCGKWYADATASVEITDHDSVILPALGHAYGDPEWTWAANGKATVSFTCLRDASHIHRIPATVTGETTQPTCTAEGKTVYTGQAAFEGNTYTDTRTVNIPALGHELHLIPAQEATCESEGNITYYLCARCHKLFADEAGAKEITLDDTVVPAKSHDWNGGLITKEPTCTEPGEKTFTCLNDPTHTRTEPVPALGHSVARVEETAATCEGEGRAAYYECTVCGRYFADATGTVEIADLHTLTIPAVGHAYGEPVWHWGEADAATAVFTCTRDNSHRQNVTASVTPDKSEVSCEQAGKLIYTAAVTFAGKTYTDSKTVNVPALGHQLRHVEAVAATCETDGHSEYWLCKQCGKYFADAQGGKEIAQESTVLPALGHEWNKGEITTPATCEGEGVKTFTCRHDPSHTRTESIPALGHKLTLVPEVKPTCETGGNIAYYECETCGRRFADGTASVEITGEVTLPAPGHRYGEWIVTRPATETEEGEETRVCQNDPTHTETRVIPKTQHVHKLTAVEAIPSTCEKEGCEAHWICKGCGRRFSDENGEKEINPEEIVLPALGHDWEEEITTQPSCTEAGVRTFTCKHDPSHTRTEVIPALGHTLLYVGEVPATCETEGHHAYYECDHCGAHFTDAAAQQETCYAEERIPALGHAYGDPAWTWEGETAAAVFTCERDENHTLTVTATVTEEILPAACEADGKRVLTAEAECGGKVFTDNRTEVIPALGHEWNEGEITTPATCEGEGVKTFTCRHDAIHTRTESIPALGHKLTLVQKVEPTCETDGNIAYYECETCSRRFADGTASVALTEEDTVLAAMGHDWNDWTVTRPATETEEGEETRVCQNDPSHTETRVIPKTEHVHQLEAVEAIPAACEKEGCGAHWICKGCGRRFSDENGEKEVNTEDLVLPALGHEWNEGEIRLSDDGRDYVVCFYCQRDASHTRILPLSFLRPSKDYYCYILLTSYLRNSDRDARLAVKHRGDDTGTFRKFLGIEMDNQMVSPAYYLASPGSVVIDLKPSYLNTLSAGSHTIRVIFTDGYVDSSFTVTTEKKPTDHDSPKTGEDSYAVFWLMMLASMTAILAYLRRKKQLA